MAIGTRMGSIKTLKQSLAKGGGNAWIKYIPKNGAMNVRFIEEPEAWVNYTEHYDQTLRKSYPCNNEANCPGCTTDERKSSRYLANAVDVDNDRVIPLQMPKDLANRLVVRYERNGTLTDRDFELSRSGDGLDTVYDLDAGAPDRKKIDKYKPLDLIKVLEDAYNDVFGAGTVEDDEDEAPAAKIGTVKAKTRSRAAAKVAVPDDAVEEDDEDDEDEAPAPKAKPAAKRAAAKRAAAKAPEPVFEVDDEDEDDEDEPVIPQAKAPRGRPKGAAALPQAAAPDDEDEDDEEGYDEDTLRALPLGALRAVAREFGVDPKGKTSDQIVDEILASGEPVGDDDPPF